MSKRSTSRPGARTSASNSRKSNSNSRQAKKRIRRVIFKTDHWYAGAALSIGIAGRPKSARPLQLVAGSAEEAAE
jgi:hypothetical protein